MTFSRTLQFNVRRDGGESMYDIDIHNAQQHVALDDEFLRDVVRQVLEAERVAAAEISIAVVDNATIRRLNRDYLNHDYDTDVLSFLLDSSDAVSSPGVLNSPLHKGGPAGGDHFANALPRGAGKRLEGEVVVSAEMAAQTAAEFRWTPQNEVVLYLVHGLLHLAGYDDLTPQELRHMRQREAALLKIWGLTPPYVTDVDPSHVEPTDAPGGDAAGEDA